MHKTFIINVPHFTAALMHNINRSSAIGSSTTDNRKYKKIYITNFMSGSNKKISKNKIPAAPTAFFITREEPIAVPATL